MRNLPALPGCGQPATIRIEVYSSSPEGGAYGSLDATAYSCPTHAGAIEQMLYDAGLSPYRMAYRQLPGEAVPAVCGTLRRFDALVEPARPADHNGEPAKSVESSAPTSGEPTDAAVAAFVAVNKVPLPGGHPRWCARTERPDGPHLSLPVHVRPDVDDGPRVALFIEQPRHTDDTAPRLVVQVDDGTLTEVVLTLVHGKRVAREIRDLVQLAGGGR